MTSQSVESSLSFSLSLFLIENDGTVARAISCCFEGKILLESIYNAELSSLDSCVHSCSVCRCLHIIIMMLLHFDSLHVELLALERLKHSSLPSPDTDPLHIELLALETIKPSFPPPNPKTQSLCCAAAS
ncbi:hypothetical protein KP509_17G014600 [Ceratopteris richardii]|uniref:Uncharacterized protein n=1 Tax=Ceratopteris richardii TaxID=49495 RepID=A0A8T2SSB2_CERRI|nr:hypothetical protein KP509_17G014600 [Ceratopteris richardii]